MTRLRAGTAGPQLLYLSPVVPATSGNGLAMRAGMVLQLLSRHYSVSLLVVRLYAPYDALLPAAIARLCSRTALLPADRFAPRPSPFRPPPLLNLFGRAVRGWSARASDGIKAAGRAFRGTPFDVVHVFRLSMLPFARPYFGESGQTPKRHLDLDDLESATRRRLAELYRLNNNGTMARFEELEAERAEALEAEALQQFDRFYVCSEEDKTELDRRSRGRVCVLPNALPLPGPLPPKRGDGPFTFLFVGTLGYYPNEDAILHFCAEVLPLIRQATQQDVRVTIVGTGATPAIRRLADLPEVRLIGAVPDVAPWYREADAVIVPVRAGGGTRIKVLEAFSYERPVVSTSIGIEGIAARAEEHVLVGDTAPALAAQCLRLMAGAPLAERLTRNATALFVRAYTLDAVARRFAQCT
jgi:glycosyltransferase involved in cell wall biosynthesis